VLDLSKIEAGKMTLNETDVNLDHLLNDAVDLFRLRAEKKGLQILFDSAPDVPQYVRTDEAKLRQVLINLLNNAIKFTEEGKVSLRVYELNELHELGESKTQKLKNSKTHKTLRFEIEDTGPGIAPEEMDKLFEAFAQTETGIQAQEGTGLGLPISQKFVQLMDGDIHAKSEVGHGTTFTFEIQVGVVEAPDMKRTQPTRRVIGLEPDQPHYRILIVDDKPDNRKLLVKLLNPFGFELQEAINGQEALEIWKQWEPHLIWMDIRMPVMGGYEATKHIKSETRNSKSEIQTVIIAVTASSFEEEQAVVLSAGCDDFLRKPFKESDIFDLMHKHLGVRFMYEESQKSKVKSQKLQVENVLTPAALVALPDELHANLRRAVNVIDLEMTITIIKRIRQQNEPLADALSNLVKQFRFDILQTLFEETE